MKIGIALGGGGAKGFAHIGVLNILTNAGIEFDVVSGTSIGALVGAVYAEGGLKSLERSSTKIKLTDIPMLLSPTWPKQGLFSGKKVLDLLNELVAAEDIKDLKKPFAAVCVDLNRGEIVTLTEGNLRQAVRASIAIPGVFTPVITEDKLLVDGGVLEPVPVEAARSLGADFVIAVDLLAGPHFPSRISNRKGGKAFDREIKLPVGAGESDHAGSIWERKDSEVQSGLKAKDKRYELGIIEIIQVTSLVTQKNMAKYRLRQHPSDFLIAPDLADVGMFDFHRGDSTIKIGEEAAKAAVPKLIEEIARRIATQP